MPDTSGPSSERSQLLGEVAQRLRRLEAGRAQQSDAVFTAQVAAEVKRALSRVAPESQEAFLGEVQSRFPNWDLGVNAAPSQAPAAVAPMELDSQSEIAR